MDHASLTPGGDPIYNRSTCVNFTKKLAVNRFAHRYDFVRRIGL